MAGLWYWGLVRRGGPLLNGIVPMFSEESLRSGQARHSVMRPGAFLGSS